ncbi:hypothetical protein [Natronolimnohabitans innermongolicus]|nr:hypothetical protein [Natronolimnohabitans innermongolicus]
MTKRSRRTVLCGSAGLLALSAGCLSDAGLSDDGNGDENDPGAGGNGDENDDPEESTGKTSIDDVAFGFTAGPGAAPSGTLFASDGVATSWLEAHGLEDDQLTEFVAETDFENAAVVALEADAPTPCHELALETTDLEGADEDAALEITAEVRADDADDAMGCAQVESVVGRLVRAPIDADATVSVTITDRDGDERAFEIDGAADGSFDVTETIDAAQFEYGTVPTEPDGALLSAADRTLEWLGDRDLDDEYADFVDATDFESADVVALEADAPTRCYELVLEAASLDGRGALDLEAAVSDESTEDELCGEAEQTVGLLVRTPVASDSVSATLTDRDGDDHSIELSADDATDA